MRFIAFLFVLFLMISCKSQSQPLTGLQHSRDNNSLLWEVSGNGLNRPSYIFGTFHLLCKEDINFSENLKSAIERSEFVYMELKMDDPDLLSKSLPLLLMKNNTTLKELAAPADYEKLNVFFTDSLHMPLLMMQSIKPFFLEAMLYPKMLACSAPSGIEEELLKIIKLEKKEIKGLETMEFQAGIFDSIPYKDQLSVLIESISKMDSSKIEFQKMVRLYKGQQLDSINKITEKEQGLEKQYNRILLVDRNKRWATILRDEMRMHPLFVAVGAAHLGGSAGLVELFRKQGFTVSPIIN